MITWFDILQDKFDTPYFTDTEKYNFLNDAQLNYINRFLDLDKDGRVRLEESKVVNAALQPIIVSGTLATTTATAWSTSTAYTIGNRVLESTVTYICTVAHTSGTFATDLSSGYWVVAVNVSVSRAYVTTQLNIVPDIIIPLAFATSSGAPIPFVRFNDVYTLVSSGSLKAPTTTLPVYTIDGAGYSFYPDPGASPYTNMFCTILRMPVDITASVNCELTEFTHRKIVAMGMVKTGFVTESQSTALMNEGTDG